MENAKNATSLFAAPVGIFTDANATGDIVQTATKAMVTVHSAINVEVLCVGTVTRA
jgi:hypothetical protein